MASVKASYKGDALFEIAAGKHTFPIDLPASFGGKDRAVGPTTLFASSLAACIGALVHKYCLDMKINDEGMTVDLTYEYLDKPSRLGKFKAKISLPKGDWQSRKDGILRAAHRCPVHETILQHEGLEVTVE